MLVAGDKVKYSEYALRSSRDYWLSQGREPDKSRAKGWYEAKRAERGTIIAIHDTQWAKGSPEIQWENGTTSKCLSYMVDKAE